MLPPTKGFAVLALLLATGCGVAPTVDRAWFEALAPGHDAGVFDFSGAARILSGFDPPAERQRMRAGDELLYGIGVARGASSRAWLVRIVVEQEEVASGNGSLAVVRSFTVHSRGATRHIEFSSPLMALRVHTYAGGGRPLGEEVVQVPRRFLQEGVFDACKVLRRLSHRTTDEPVATADMRTVAASVNALLAFFDLARGSKRLAPILGSVVGMPSVWSVIRHFGVSVALDARLQESLPDRVEIGAGELPAFRVPVVIKANGEPVLRCSMRVVEPTSPLNLGAGIVSVVGVRPGEPATRVVMRILAARRGTGGQRFATAAAARVPPRSCGL